MRLFISTGLLSLGLWASTVTAAPAPCTAKDGHVICSAKSAKKRSVSLDFTTKAVVVDTSTGVLCTDPAVALSSLKMWMPDHNHGTSDPDLKPHNANCIKLEGIEFLMDGHWEFRLKYQDGDTATIDVTVEE